MNKGTTFHPPPDTLVPSASLIGCTYAFPFFGFDSFLVQRNLEGLMDSSDLPPRFSPLLLLPMTILNHRAFLSLRRLPDSPFGRLREIVPSQDFMMIILFVPSLFKDTFPLAPVSSSPGFPSRTSPLELFREYQFLKDC